MAPKKDPKKEPVKVEVSSLYERRDANPPPEAPDASEVEDAWRSSCNDFVQILPEWDREAVNTTDWKPREVETFFAEGSFNARVLRDIEGFAPKELSAWKRASAGAGGPDEPEPQLRQPAPVDVEKASADPKGKGKPDPKKAAAKPTPDGGGAAPTAQQFAELEPSEVVVVDPAQFRSRQTDISSDDAMPALSQAIASQLALIGEQRKFIPKGSFLWELIYPQDEEGRPLHNPHGKYVVKLFVQGRWRQVLIDDVVPFGKGIIGDHAPLLPSDNNPNIIWPQLLSKALLRVFQVDLNVSFLQVIPALTGWLPYQVPFSWDALRSLHGMRPFCCLQLTSAVDVEAHQKEELIAASAAASALKDGRKGMAPMTPVGMPPLNLPGGPEKSSGPRLGSSPFDALLRFLVCEVDEDPRQLRLKAASWLPPKGKPTKVEKDALDSEVEEEDEDKGGRDAGNDMGMDEDEHDEDEEEEHSSPRPGSGEEQTAPSARSKEDGGALPEAASPIDNPEMGSEEMPRLPSLWPDSSPPALLTRSVMHDYISQVEGGYWVTAEDMESLKPPLESIFFYSPPDASSLSARLDSAWADRSEPFVPPTPHILKLRLIPKEIESQPGHDSLHLADLLRRDDKVWHRASFSYEPVHTETGAAKSQAGSSCLFQNISFWQPQPFCGGAPDFIHLGPGESSASGVCESVLLPSGRCWYLVVDDALRAGSTITVHVEGAMLNVNESDVVFVEPALALEEKGVVILPMEPTEYPAQLGFSIWAKAEVTLSDILKGRVPFFQLLSHLSDPALQPHLRLLFLEVTEGTEDAGTEAGGPASRCAKWSTTKTLASAPLTQVMTLPLDMAAKTMPASGQTSPSSSQGGPLVDVKNDPPKRVKYVVMLEANVPAVAKAGRFSLQLLLPPPPEDTAGASDFLLPPRPPGDSEPPAEDSAPLRLTSLKIDKIMRWRNETQPNPKFNVLRERITVPHGGGDLTMAIRVTVKDLPQAFLRATLIAQLPPTEEMLPPLQEGVPPRETPEPGTPIDPKEYGGRRNWLDSCTTVLEESGVEVVMMPHAILYEGSTYILDVCIDQYRGPGQLEGGSWLLELQGSGEVEVGADTTEEDLEGLVRRSWEAGDIMADGTPNSAVRKDRANTSRRRWMISRGLIEGTPDDEDTSSKAASPEPPASSPKPPKEEKPGKNKRGSDAPPAEEKPDADALKRQAEKDLEMAFERAETVQHSNAAMADFLYQHTKEPAVLIAEDPYTIMPIPDDWFTKSTEEALEKDAPEAPGIFMRGLAGAREAEVKREEERWARIHSSMEAAVEKNDAAIGDLAEWREAQNGNAMAFLEDRQAIVGGLQDRAEKRDALKEMVHNPEVKEAPPIREALEDAEKAEVSVWDAELVDAGKAKASLFESLGDLKTKTDEVKQQLAAVAEDEAAAGPDPGAAQDIAALIKTVKESRRKLQTAKVELPQEVADKLAELSGTEELLAQLKEIGEKEAAKAGEKDDIGEDGQPPP